MAKGIIYLMITVVSGLIKIGKTGNDKFENRMRFLESRICQYHRVKKGVCYRSRWIR